jgi:hypothetical protein
MTEDGRLKTDRGQGDEGQDDKILYLNLDLDPQSVLVCAICG